jgi:threonine aldolase
MRSVDLRSDTVTLPTKEMLDAIHRAKLGDDVYGEDPTVKQLEETAAKRMGKDAALLVTSGTQGNLVSALCHTKRGDEVVFETEAHMYYYEGGGYSALAGLSPRLVKGQMGVMFPEDVENSLRPLNVHYAPTSLICIENTHNRAGGTVWSSKQIGDIADVAKAHNLTLHMDGARIFNAAIALNVDVRDLTKQVDSLMFCLSKGLSAPIGSLVVGSNKFIDSARRYRKMLGGGMRQAGVIAAAGIVALEKMVDRLRNDHDNAKTLADGLLQIPGISLDMKTVQTNIVIYDVNGLGITGTEWVKRLKAEGILAGAQEHGRIRMVTHYGIEKEDIDLTLKVVERMAKNMAK